MKLARVEMLYLIWMVPVLLLVILHGARRRRRILTRYASSRGLSAIVPEGGERRRWAKAALLLTAMGLGGVALAGPQYGYRWEEIEQKGVDLIIAMDCSRSMLADDIKPTRLDRAKREIHDLLTIVEGDRVGLVAFAGTAFLQCPLTLDYSGFHVFLDVLSPDFLPVGGTDLAGAIRVAVDGFDPKTNTEKAVILITDGENTGDGDPFEAAEAARKAGITLFAIGVGGVEGVPVPDSAGGFRKDPSGKIVLTRLDEETLKKVAVTTGGAYVRSVAGDMDLDAIYTERIRKEMQRETVKSGRRQVWEDRYQWVLSLAVLALLTELFIASRRPRRSLGVLLVLMLVGFGPTGTAGAEDAFREGVRAYRAEEYDRALNRFIEAQIESPDRPEILYNIGNAYYRTGDFESAADSYRQALQSAEGSLRRQTLYNLGNAAFRLGRYDEAIEHFEAALALDASDDKARDNIAYVRKVKEAARQRQQPETPGDQEQSGGDEGTGAETGEGRDGPEQTEDNSESAEAGDEAGGESENRQGQQGKTDGAAERPDTEGDDSAPAPIPAGEETGDESGEEMAAGAGEAEGEGDETAGQPGAMGVERMLNRLKDEPGRAMMPPARKGRVERDW